MDLSIVMVNFNTPELTGQAVKSVENTTRGLAYELIVVDNSTDPQKRYRPGPFSQNVRVLAGVENKGFGHACNLGAGQAAGDYLLFLNSDTILEEGCLQKCMEFIKAEENIGALGIHTVLKDGTLDHGCKRGFPTPAASLYYFLGLDQKHPESRKYGAYRQTFLDENQTADVDAVSGAFLLMPRAVFEETGGYDETFFMYGEDLDLCYRVKEKGYRVVYFAGASMTHLKGQSGLHTASKEIVYHFHHAMVLFYNKHYRSQYNGFVNGAVYTGIWAKYCLTRLKATLKKGR